MKRRLSAILAADVVGYSAMMGTDEKHALSVLRLLRDQLFEPEVERWRGTVVKRLGDGWLVEYASVIDAVNCAVAIQKNISDIPDLAIRIGLHLGDVVHEDNDIYGDGVNIASRLEAISAPGHVLISEDVQRQLTGRIGIEFHDLGPVALKNIAKSVNVWSWPERLTGLSNTTPMADAKPRIHAGPFNTNLSESSELAEALRHDLSTAFARQSGIISVDDPESADYVVTGAVRGSGDRWRISASLTDKRSGQVVWSERFDERGDDFFELQDRCLTRIAGAIRIRMPSLLAEKTVKRPLQHLNVEELLNHAMNQHLIPTIQNWDAAAVALRLALEKDSNSWMAMTMLCWNTFCRVRIFGWRPIDDSDRRLAGNLIENAKALRPNSEVVRLVHGAYLLYAMRNHRVAEIEIEESLRLNPDYYHAINLMSQVALFSGNMEKASDWARRSVDCDPGYPYLHLYQRDAGYVHLVSKRYTEALGCFWRADRAAAGLPQNLVGIIIGSQLSGNLEDAHKAVESLLEVAPNFNITDYDSWPFRDSSEWVPFESAMIAAGVPLK